MNAAHEFIGDMAEQVSMPDVYHAIRKLLQDPDTTLEDFAGVVESDSMLSRRVMLMATSRYFGIPGDCDSLPQAIGMIGLIQLHDLVLGCLCLRAFSSIPEKVFNLRDFWHYSVQCGIAAKTIAQMSRGDNT